MAPHVFVVEVDRDRIERGCTRIIWDRMTEDFDEALSLIREAKAKNSRSPWPSGKCC